MAGLLFQNKQELLAHCIEVLQERSQAIHKTVVSLQNAQQNETKSSAGDKFETSREMMQSEIDKLEGQRSQILTDLTRLKLHQKSPVLETIQEGSMVKTDKGIFLISVGLGRIRMHETTYFVISKDAPIARPILGKDLGDIINFNNVQYTIEGIC